MPTPALFQGKGGGAPSHAKGKESLDFSKEQSAGNNENRKQSLDNHQQQQSRGNRVALCERTHSMLCICDVVL